MLFAASVLVALLPLVAAQTSTNCDPTKKSCPDDPGFAQTTTTFDFQKEGLGKSWTALGFADKISQDSSGLHFSIDASGEAPTLTSNGIPLKNHANIEYVFFGKVTAVVKAADGAGIVSSVILQSGDLDEIDWEWLGGDTTQVQTNYFSKGDTTTYDRGGTHSVSNPQTTLHSISSCVVSNNSLRNRLVSHPNRLDHRWHCCAYIDSCLSWSQVPPDSLPNQNRLMVRRLHQQCPRNNPMGRWTDNFRQGSLCHDHPKPRDCKLQSRRKL
jgi:hypothetical protein